MAKFDVQVPEVWMRMIRVEAKTKEEAVTQVHAKLQKGEEINDNDFEFSHVLPRENWDAREI